MAEHDDVLRLVLVILQVVVHGLLVANSQCLHVVSVFEVVVARDDFHEVVVATVLFRLQIVVLANDTVTDSDARFLPRAFTSN